MHDNFCNMPFSYYLKITMQDELKQYTIIPKKIKNRITT